MDEEPAPSEPKGFSVQKFWRELKRRHVVRVASVYAVAGWLVIQVASSTFASFGIPDWAHRFVVLMVLLGFPIALIIAWAFELTPEGIKVTTAASTNEPNEPAASSTKRGWLSILFAAGLPTLIFGTLAVFFYFREGGSVPTDGSTKTSEAVTATPLVAVLPFVNLSTVEENAFFAAGVHEDILTHLSRLPGMQVISRTSVMRYAQSSQGVREIAAELGARFIVEGSVRRINNHVRVTAQLIDASNDAHLWANNYDRELVDVFATQSAVAKEITNSLLLEISPESVDELSDMPTFSVKAYDLYLKALSIDRSEPESKSSLNRQRELLEAAVAEDPDFVEAWGFLNEICDHSTRLLMTGKWTVSDEDQKETLMQELRQTAEQALNKAIALDPTNIETLLARASDVVREQSDPNFRNERKAILDEALARYPDNAIVWYTLAWWHSLGGEIAAANTAFEKALVLDPLHARILYGAIVYFNVQRDTDRANELMTRLPQISTEKYSDPQLLSAFIQGQLRDFYQTGNEARLRPIAEAIEKGSGNFPSDLYEHVIRSLVNMMQLEDPSELEELCETSTPYTLEELISDSDTGDMRLVNDTIRTLCDLSGDTAKAEEIARDLLEFYKQVPPQHSFDAMFQANCFAYLGDIESARSISGEWLSKEIDIFHRLKMVYTVDLDEGAELFAELAAENLEIITGIGAFQIYHRKLLEHPKVKGIMVEDGRWLPYLSKRIPAYAEYRVGSSP